MKLLELFLLLLFNYIAANNLLKNKSLKLVHVIIRHGDRTNVPYTTYPKDPYKDEPYHPFGIGQLTMKGKRDSLEVGKALRQRYNEFLGEVYIPHQLEAWSSDTSRTKMSLQAVLAGLFPPNENETLDSALNWQPIPFSYREKLRDPLFFGHNCSNFQKLLQEYESRDEIQNEFRKNGKLLEYIYQETGRNCTNYLEVFFLYSGLLAEESWGFKLPSWTERVYPEPLRELSYKHYLIATGTDKLKSIVGGYLLEKIVEDTRKQIRKGPKIFLYCGHEYSIAYTLEILKAFVPHIPNYSAYLVFEIHEIDSELFIKIIYQNYEAGGLKNLILPNCTILCPFSSFVSRIEKYFPKEDTCGNEKCL